MKETQKKDKSIAVLSVAVSVVAILTALSAIPPFEINGVHIHRANLLSPFVSMDDDISISSTSSEWVEGDKLISKYTEKTVRKAPESMVKLIPLPQPGVVTPQKNVPQKDVFQPQVASAPAPVTKPVTEPATKPVPAPASASVPAPTHSHDGVVIDDGIEDYSASGQMMERFIRSLYGESVSRNVRIAFLGDSFIEGDILTSSLRNAMHDEFGGEGAGFVPFADPIAKWRLTVRQEHSGWKCYNLLRKKNVPERYKNDFYISGYVCVPSPGAKARFTTGSYKGHKLSSSHARIYFKNRGEGMMNVVVNGCDTLSYSLNQGDDVQCIDVCHQQIEVLSVSLPVCNDFVGYGVVFEGDRGVTVDNYALRSHSGTSLLATSYAVNSQMSELLKYDLIVMEYGLNAMQKSVTQYKSYMDKLRKTVEYVRSAFPQSAIMLMSVGDVGMKVDNQIITAPAVPAMVGGQRLVAMDCDVSFLNMFHEMGGEGSMKKYVENGWANKDYLHINPKGGDKIAELILGNIHKMPGMKRADTNIWN